MTIADFLSELFEHGRVRVGPFGAAISPDDWLNADSVLIAWDQAVRAEFPGQAPSFEAAVARWAAEQFYRAAQFFVFRDLSGDALRSALSAACPLADGASQHYSVDLVFRFLPDLYRQARLLSHADPLCEKLSAWARDWPLSSIGIALDPPADVTCLTVHEGLWRQYIDRVVALKDWTRLKDARVRQQLRADMGFFAELAPDLAAQLTKTELATLNQHA